VIHLTEISIFVSNQTVDFGTKETPNKFNFHVSVISTTCIVRTFDLSYGKEKVKCTVVQSLMFMMMMMSKKFPNLKTHSELLYDHKALIFVELFCVK
jgi:hypothetical protein